MRKKFWFLITVGTLVLFAACSKDKDDGIAGKIAGTYVGTITVTQEDGSEMGEPIENQKIYMNQTGDNTLDLQLLDFSFQGLNVGDLKISGVQAQEDGSLSGSASQVPIMGGAIKADLTLSGTAKNNQADLLIVVNAPLAPGTDAIVMNVTFKGSK